MMGCLSFAIAFSSHLGLAGEYNEVHPSVRCTKDYFIAGAYLNSENNVSPYVGLRYEMDRFYVEGGAVWGYSYAPIAPYVRAGYSVTDTVSIFIAPAYEAPNTIGAVVGVEFSF